MLNEGSGKLARPAVHLGGAGCGNVSRSSSPEDGTVGVIKLEKDSVGERHGGEIQGRCTNMVFIRYTALLIQKKPCPSFVAEKQVAVHGKILKSPYQSLLPRGLKH